jgi:hypothetical protein
MTGPPKPSSLRLSEHVRSPLVGATSVLETTNSPNPTECLASRLVPGIRRGTEPRELRHRTCLPRISVRAKATLEIQHNERCAPPRGRARSALHRTGWCIQVAQMGARAISLLGDGTILSPVPTPVSPNSSANGER